MGNKNYRVLLHFTKTVPFESFLKKKKKIFFNYKKDIFLPKMEVFCSSA